MNGNESGPRRYSEKEVGLILRRATELQRAEPTAADPSGLTITELEEIAAEAGIDPALLRQAANELHTLKSASVGSRLAGAPIEVLIERTVDGDLPRDRLEDLIPVIQAATSGQGTASAVGRTLTWSSRTESNTSSQQVLVSAREGRTLIRVEERFGGLAGALFGGIVGGVGGGVGFGLGGALGGVVGLRRPRSDPPVRHRRRIVRPRAGHLRRPGPAPRGGRPRPRGPAGRPGGGGPACERAAARVGGERRRLRSAG